MTSMRNYSVKRSKDQVAGSNILVVCYGTAIPKIRSPYNRSETDEKVLK